MAVSLALKAQNILGQVPPEFSKLRHLERLELSHNCFNGFIPPNLLSSNSFTGELPVALAKLIKLNDMRISDNNFVGKIPFFIGNWTQIEKVHIQGCPLEGPIPFSIFALTSLSDILKED